MCLDRVASARAARTRARRAGAGVAELAGGPGLRRVAVRAGRAGATRVRGAGIAPAARGVVAGAWAFATGAVGESFTSRVAAFTGVRRLVRVREAGAVVVTETARMGTRRRGPARAGAVCAVTE